MRISDELVRFVELGLKCDFCVHEFFLEFQFSSLL